jgi:demethylmenaquinone methyltransferase/2-methoxy-6-polyprenyl-1,4-benzoquinol methylase
VAAGTADLTLALARQYPAARIYALDFSLGMLERGIAKVRERGAGERVRFIAGDALALPFADSSFDAVTSGFLMRNVTDIVRAFAEMRRVVRPGGRVVCLEISKPVLPLFSRLFWWYFTRVVPAMGRLVSGNAEAYRYLPQSLAQFVTAEELKGMMEQAGLEEVTYRRLMLGTVAIHVGKRPG